MPFATQNSYKDLIFESVRYMMRHQSSRIFPVCSELEVLKQKPHYYKEK